MLVIVGVGIFIPVAQESKQSQSDDRKITFRMNPFIRETAQNPIAEWESNHNRDVKEYLDIIYNTSEYKESYQASQFLDSFASANFPDQYTGSTYEPTIPYAKVVFKGEVPDEVLRSDYASKIEGLEFVSNAGFSQKDLTDYLKRVQDLLITFCNNIVEEECWKNNTNDITSPIADTLVYNTLKVHLPSTLKDSGKFNDEQKNKLFNEITELQKASFFDFKIEIDYNGNDQAVLFQ
ncbi:MAG: hypothetical protein LBQ41_02925 [Candidatus Ancillula sp.]|nr:hypothetical protein [Candidatus Ancillula sp.]